MSRRRTVLATACALVAFALNPLLCRLALQAGTIDAVSFTLVRLATGAAFLVSLVLATGMAAGPARARVRGDWPGAAFLFAYAICFALAYRDLAASTGTLILFAAVQATMIGWGLRCGERLTPLGGSGFLLAVAGLVVLTAPGIAAPTPRGSVLMVLAGLAWGVYSLRGRGTADPLAATAGNFLRAAVPAALALGAATVLASAGRHLSGRGLLLAALSGALASGAGYVAWYAALRRLAATSAASLQLLVPVLAAVGGVMFLGEHATGRLIVAAMMILGGVAGVLYGRRRAA